MVVGHRALLEGHQVLVVQRIGAGAADHGDVALVELHLDLAGDHGLGIVDGRLQHLALGREPEAVVDQRGVLRHQLVLQVHGPAVERDGFHAPVGGEQDRAAGGLVDAARLHADEAVLHQVQAADAVVVAELVQLGQQGGGRQLLAVDGHRVAALEVEGEDGGLIRRVFRGDGALVHELGGFHARIFQHFALGGGVQEVGVDRERGLAALVLGDRDLVLLGEVEQGFAAAVLPLAPGGDHADVGLQRIVAELEADLVVALAGGAMADGVGADLAGDLDLLLGDQRTGDGGAEQVLALIDRVGPEHREHVVPHELLAQVFDEDVLRLDPEQQRLLARRPQLLALAQVGGEGHHLRAVLGLQPLQDDGGVQPAGIGEHDLLDGTGVGHGEILTTAGRARAFKGAWAARARDNVGAGALS